MFPWMKIKKISPKPITDEIPPVEPSKVKHPNFPSAPFAAKFEEMSRKAADNPFCIPVVDRRMKKNICRKLNRQKRREGNIEKDGLTALEGAPRLKNMAKRQEKKARKLMKRGLFEAKCAAEEVADDKELLKPDFKDSGSSFEHRNETRCREASRRDLEMAETATIRALRLREAAKAVKQKDQNPIDPFFDKDFINKNKHKAYFK